MDGKTYIAIDLKSFYASVECVERGLDPLTANLVVADEGRTEKTICLAVSPTLKALGIPGRARLFEVVEKVREVNARRLQNAPGRVFAGASCDARELAARPELSLSYITAAPRMAHYIAYSTRVYNTYLRYVAPEDIHVYSVDEVFMDVTDYLKTYRLSAAELAKKIILDVLQTTGVTATAGVGPNLYLCKIALDIRAKHVPADKNGVRVAQLDEAGYRRLLWTHRPLTDFWRVGRGYAAKLEASGLFTMGDVARCSLSPQGEALLYKLFGVNAELLIDHAWGYEPCTIADIKAYRPASNSTGSGQVLAQPYDNKKARLVLREMADHLALDLLDRGLVTDRLLLAVGYDVENLADRQRGTAYAGDVATDYYGRRVPKPAQGSAKLAGQTASARLITDAVLALYDRITDKNLLVRRLNLAAANVTDEAAARAACYEQLDLFTDPAQLEKERARLARERRRQEAMLAIKKKYGKNAIVKGTDLEEGATAMERNRQIGGHKA